MKREAKGSFQARVALFPSLTLKSLFDTRTRTMKITEFQSNRLSPVLCDGGHREPTRATWEIR